MTFGHCLQCDREQEDLEAHFMKFHPKRLISDREKYSGTIECDVCHNAVKTPRTKEDKSKIPPKHDCKPARVILDTNGLPIKIIGASGVDVAQYQLVVDPIE